jgi:hypothetical protein
VDLTVRVPARGDRQMQLGNIRLLGELHKDWLDQMAAVPQRLEDARKVKRIVGYSVAKGGGPCGWSSCGVGWDVRTI